MFSRKKVKLNAYHDKFDQDFEKEKKDEESKQTKENCSEAESHDHCECDSCDCGGEEHLQNEEHKHGKHHHTHAHSHCCATNIFLDALKHTAIIVAYVFAATLIINLIEGYAGGLEPLSAMFTNNVYLQILIACLVGLIPNCAASVFLVELYMSGVLFFPALVAGLCAGAGVGLIVLFTANFKRPWHNILITAALYGFAVIGGLLASLLPVV